MTRTLRHRIFTVLSAVLALQLLAATAIYVGVQRSNEQERFRQRREALQDLSKRAIIAPTPPPNPFKLLIGERSRHTPCAVAAAQVG